MDYVISSVVLGAVMIFLGRRIAEARNELGLASVFPWGNYAYTLERISREPSGETRDVLHEVAEVLYDNSWLVDRLKQRVHFLLGCRRITRAIFLYYSGLEAVSALLGVVNTFPSIRPAVVVLGAFVGVLLLWNGLVALLRDPAPRSLGL